MSFADIGQDQQYTEEDFEIIEAKTKAHKKEISQGLQRCDRIVQETNAQAATTNVELRRQGEVIKEIEEKVDHTEESLNYADHLVKSIDSFWYALNPFKKKKKKKSPDAQTGFTPSEATEASSSGASAAYKSSRVPASRSKKISEEQALEQEQATGFSHGDQQALNNIHHGLQTLKEQMVISGDQIDAQNKDLDRLGPKMEHTTNRMKKTTGKVKSMC
eukprot:TRINITY_DN3185_c0_g5_i1.p1 TRINITY_DN3185_c0_g5~~TRINITY_DN3185_c0_g5_i1.p1  ORF type:complete len:234 (+),score=69.71 TRINITY_DN3185_c0_g5_i1:51-704(+)